MNNHMKHQRHRQAINHGLLVWFGQQQGWSEEFARQELSEHATFCQRQDRALEWGVSYSIFEPRMVEIARHYFMAHVRRHRLITAKKLNQTGRLRYSEGYGGNIPPMDRWPADVLIELGILSKNLAAQTAVAIPDCTE